MNRRLIIVGLVAAAAFTVVAEERVTLNVGSVAELEAAVGTVARTTIEGDAPKAIEVVLASGVYRINRTLSLKGMPLTNTEIVFRSADREHPAEISGGSVVADWKVGADGVWRTVLPEVKEGKLNFSQLFANGARRYRPRVPEAGWYESIDHTRVVKRAPDVGAGGFTYGGDVLSSKWSNLEDAEVQMLFRWNGTRMRIAAIDEAAHEVILKSPYPNIAHLSLRKNRFAVENVKEAFGVKGQWYLDRPTGELAYTPMDGETPDNTVIEIPRVTKLLEIKGSKNLSFRDLVFRLDNRNTPRTGDYNVQAEIGIGAAVEVSNSANIVLEGCVFVNLGGWAVAMDSAVSGSRISGCVMADLGAGGVKLGSAERAAEGIAVENCEIFEGGRRNPGAPAIMAIRSKGGRFRHNHIHDFYYTGISCGWGWQVEAVPSSRDNEIAGNYIHDIGLRQLSDMGFIYLLGPQPGTRVHHNRLHDIHHWGYGSTAIYPDECSAHLEIDHNYVAASGRSLHCNMVRDLDVHDNVFIDADQWQFDFSNNIGEEENLVRYYRNTVVWNGGELMRRRKGFGLSAAEREAYNPPYWRGIEAHDNVYWRRDGETKVFPPDHGFAEKVDCRTLAEFQAASGIEKGSAYRDPGEIDWRRVCGETGVEPGVRHAVWRMPAMPRPLGPFEQYVIRRQANEITLRNGIGNFMKKLEAGEDVSIAYFGGSITEGTSWRPAVTDWLRTKYPKSKITEISAGIGGTGSGLGVFRLEHDVMRYRPDLVLVEFACNDGEGFSQAKDVARVGATIEEVVRGIWRTRPETDILFTYVITKRMVRNYGRGVLDDCAAIHDTVAERYGVPSVCFAPRVTELDRAGRLAWTVGDFATAVPKEDPEYDRKVGAELTAKGVLVFSNDNVHPRREGGELYFRALTNFFSQTMPEETYAWNRRSLVSVSTFSLDGYGACNSYEIAADELKGAWRKVAADDPKFGKFLKRTDSMWVSETPGDRVEFEFTGRELALYAAWGQNGAKLKVEVDGRRIPDIQLFDRYCTYFRVMKTPVWKGERGRHRVVLTILEEQPDRMPVVACRKIPVARVRSAEFDGHVTALGRILVDGEIERR